MTSPVQNVGRAAQPPAWREAPSPVAVLRACAWLRPDEVAHPLLRINAAKSSHEVFRVTAPDGRCVVVKRLPLESATKGRSLRQELFVYRLAAWMPQVAALLPRPIFLDEARQLLVVECLDRSPLWPDPTSKLPLLRHGVATAVARAVAQLHSATAHMGMAASGAAGVLGMAADVSVATQGRREEVVALMHTIVADAKLHSLLTQGLAQYQHNCIIHGDLRPDNWVGTGTDSQPSLRLIDLEMAGSGDAAWDLGSLLAQALIESLQAPDGGPAATGAAALAATVSSTLAPTLAPTLALTFGWADPRALQAILAAYFKVPGPLDPAHGPTWHRLILYAAARLLHVATECADQGLRPGQWPVLNLLQAAKGLAQNTPAAAHFLRCQFRAVAPASKVTP
jgi:Phosphotransferase enzyme family